MRIEGHGWDSHPFVGWLQQTGTSLGNAWRPLKDDVYDFWKSQMVALGQVVQIERVYDPETPSQWLRDRLDVSQLEIAAKMYRRKQLPKGLTERCLEYHLSWW